jgi:hypothetical protein
MTTSSAEPDIPLFIIYVHKQTHEVSPAAIYYL